MQSEKRKKVVIIGAGLSGLTAANDILDAQKSAQIIVIEAMDRVGGRTCSTKVNGTIFEMGAEWIGPGQDLAKQLALKSGNQLSPQFCEGRKVMQFGTSIQTYQSDIPKNVGFLGLIELQLMLWKIDRMANTIPLENPNLCENAVEWDSQTLASWIHKTVWIHKVKILLQLSCRAVFCCETNQISLLFFLWYIHHNGGVDRVVNIKNGLQQTKMLKGTQSMSEYLKTELEKKGGKVILKAFVSKIQNSQKGCAVHSICGKVFQADYVIVALPPANVKKIKFLPDLSANRRIICNRQFLGQCTKLVLLYNEPYWRQKGYSGQILGDCRDSPLMMAYDDSRPNQKGEIQYAMVVFVTAGVLREWLYREDWQQKVLNKLVQIFKCEEMKNPTKMEWKNWEAESSAEGSYAAYYPPGALTQIKDLRKPEGRIHWAGTQLARRGQGYMEGAIESGQRVANQIIKKFKNQQDIPQPIEGARRRQGYFYTEIIGGKP